MKFPFKEVENNSKHMRDTMISFELNMCCVFLVFINLFSVKWRNSLMN